MLRRWPSGSCRTSWQQPTATWHLHRYKATHVPCTAGTHTHVFRPQHAVLHAPWKQGTYLGIACDWHVRLGICNC